MKREKRRIALVNQRYGLEVNGGSEYYTRQLAEHLNVLYNVEVLTTKALDYDTWENYYTEDVETIDGILVRRFKVEKKRNVTGMKIWNRLRRYLPAFRCFFENRWIDAQGPYSSDLICYMEAHAQDYDAILFVTYLYYHTVRGVPKVADRAILIPTAHDEPYIYFTVFERIFSLPCALIYLTSEEKKFVEMRFPAVAGKPNCVAGTGVELPEHIDNAAFRQKYGIKGDYFVYVGRIDPSKGCQEMFHSFREYKKRHPESLLQLVLMGKTTMEIPHETDIVSLGFVTEEDKFNGISGARALWLPSRYESLSIAVLEAMALGVPVLVNGECEVLRGHCERSGGGIFYNNTDDLLGKVDLFLKGEKRQKMSGNALNYISTYYNWNIVLKEIDQLIQSVLRQRTLENKDGKI